MYCDIGRPKIWIFCDCDQLRLPWFRVWCGKEKGGWRRLGFVRGTMASRSFYIATPAERAVPRIYAGTRSKARRDVSLLACGNCTAAARHYSLAQGRRRLDLPVVWLTRVARHGRRGRCPIVWLTRQARPGRRGYGVNVWGPPVWGDVPQIRDGVPAPPHRAVPAPIWEAPVEML